MFINFYIARPTCCLILMYTCGLTVVIKRICYVNKSKFLHLQKFRQGTSIVASVVNLVRLTAVASLSHWASAFVYNRMGFLQFDESDKTRRVWRGASGCRGDWISIPILISYPQKNLWESPQNSHTHRTPKSSISMPHILCLFVRCILKKAYLCSTRTGDTVCIQ